MDIREHSSQFSIFVFTSNVDVGASVKVYLSQAGYDSYYLQDAETFLKRVEENPPHVIVFFTSSLEGALSEFVEKIHAINDDIKFICVSATSQFDILAQYNSWGFADVISDESAAIESRIVWSVDRACEKIYLTYQNEQLLEDLEKSQEKTTELHQVALESMKKIEDEKSRPLPPLISNRLVQYRSASSKEDLVQRYLDNIDGKTLCIFFKYLSSVRSFVATHGQGVEVGDIKGVGVQLDAESAREMGSQILMGLLPAKFNQMLSEAFKLNPPQALPLYAGHSLEGVFVFSNQLPDSLKRHLTEEFSLFSIVYSHFVLEKRVDSLEVQDFVTEVYNRNYYLRALTDEVNRSRRLRTPVSVVKVALDDIYEIEQSKGETVRDELLKALATVVHKTSRTNDLTCRSAANEIAMILPHCSKKGAALRAERLRRIIEGSVFLESGIKVSVSAGISEYPSLCDGAKSLDESASKALLHIIDKGGNKICLFKASDQHQPEFEISIE